VIVNVAHALELVSLDDLIAVDGVAGLGVDELLGHVVAGRGI
jgi:hypothetical protein